MNECRKRQRTGALQKLAHFIPPRGTSRSVLECSCPLTLFPATQFVSFMPHLFGGSDSPYVGCYGLRFADQMERMASSSPKPSGTAEPGLLA